MQYLRRHRCKVCRRYRPQYQTVSRLRIRSLSRRGMQSVRQCRADRSRRGESRHGQAMGGIHGPASHRPQLRPLRYRPTRRIRRMRGRLYPHRRPGERGRETPDCRRMPRPRRTQIACSTRSGAGIYRRGVSTVRVPRGAGKQDLQHRSGRPNRLRYDERGAGLLSGRIRPEGNGHRAVCRRLHGPYPSRTGSATGGSIRLSSAGFSTRST